MRRIRLVVSLGAALLLATALIYTSFNASSEAKTPSQLLQTTASPDRSYQLTGKVVDGSIKRDGDVTSFEVRDRTGDAKVAVRYKGAIPDTFRAGREIIITVKQRGDVYIGEHDSLITKCPSKFTDKTTTTTSQ